MASISGGMRNSPTKQPEPSFLVTLLVVELDRSLGGDASPDVPEVVHDQWEQARDNLAPWLRTTDPARRHLPVGGLRADCAGATEHWVPDAHRAVR